MASNRTAFIWIVCMFLIAECIDRGSSKEKGLGTDDPSTTKNEDMVLTRKEAILWMEENDGRPIQAFTSPDQSDIPDGEKGDRIRKAIDIAKEDRSPVSF